MRSASTKQIASIGIGLLVLIALLVWAGSPVTPPTVQISADTAANAPTPAWTSLGSIRYQEQNSGEILTGSLTINAPPGFEFRTNNTVSVVIAIGGNFNQNINNVDEGDTVVSSIPGGGLTVTATSIRFTVTASSKGSAFNRLRWDGIQIRPLLGGPLASGNVTITLPPNSTNQQGSVMATVQMIAGAPSRIVTVLPGQAFTSGVGVSNTQTPVTAGSSFNLSKLVVTDQFFNTALTYNASNRTISYSGPTTICGNPASIFTTTVSFTGGESTTALATSLFGATTSATIIASDIAANLTGAASSALTVLAGAPARLFVTVPNQTFGACGASTGTIVDQPAGVAFPITITATDAYFNIANNPALPYKDDKALTYEGPSGPTITTSPVTFTDGVATGVPTTIANAQTNTFWRVKDGTITSSNSNLFDVVGSAIGAFNAFETATVANAVSGPIKTKVAGTPFTVDLVALSGANQISSGFAGSVGVEVVDASDTNKDCTNWTSVASHPTPQVFTGTASARITMTALTVANAYRNAKIRLTYNGTAPSTLACSTDSFAVRPSKFGPVSVRDNSPTTPGTDRVLESVALASAITHRAGHFFTISAPAQNSTGTVLSNYTGTPVVTISQCASGDDACPATLGTLLTSAWGVGASPGITSTSTATYSEAGSFSLSLQDQSFADIDVSDTPAAERFFSTETPGTAGRFTPDHFVVSAAAVLPRSALGACVTSVFSYMDEKFATTFTLTANNAAGIKTANYTGNLAKLDPNAGSHLNFGAINAGTVVTPLVAEIAAITQANPGRITTVLPHGLQTGTKVFLSGIGGMTQLNNTLVSVVVVDTLRFSLSGAGADTTSYTSFVSGGSVSRLAFVSGIGAWTAGTLNSVSTLTFSRQLAPEAPLDAVSIGILPIDTDGITIATGNLNADGDGLATLERAFLGTTKLRFGRLAVRPAYGSQLLDLRIPFEAQQFNGNGFVVNTDDSCTTIANAYLTLSAFTDGASGINAGTLPQSNLPVSVTTTNGRGQILLRRPTTPPTGRGGAVLTINLQPPPAAGANLPHLLGNWDNAAVFNSNPSVRFTFGNYRPTPVIYAREVY